MFKENNQFSIQAIVRKAFTASWKISVDTSGPSAQSAAEFFDQLCPAFEPEQSEQQLQLDSNCPKEGRQSRIYWTRSADRGSQVCKDWE